MASLLCLTQRASLPLCSPAESRDRLPHRVKRSGGGSLSSSHATSFTRIVDRAANLISNWESNRTTTAVFVVPARGLISETWTRRPDRARRVHNFLRVEYREWNDSRGLGNSANLTMVSVVDASASVGSASPRP